MKDLEWEKLCSEFLLIVDFVALLASLPRLYLESLGKQQSPTDLIGLLPVQQLLFIVLLFLVFLSTEGLGEKTGPAASSPIPSSSTSVLGDGASLHPFGAVIDKSLEKRVSRND